MAEGGALILATQFPLKALLSVGCLLPASSLQKINEGDDRLVTYFSLISITPAIKLPKSKFFNIRKWTIIFYKSHAKFIQLLTGVTIFE